MDSRMSPVDALREALPSLRGATRRLAEHLLHEPGRAARTSVTALAQECDVAPSTVSRLAVRLGYDGFPDLRAALATEHGRALQGGWERDIGTDLRADDPPERLLDVLAAQQHRAAQASLAAVDVSVAATIAHAITTAPRVLLHGSWADAIALDELRIRLLRLGVAVWLHADATAARVAAGTLSEGDLLLVLSRSGADVSTADLLDRATARGARTALITGAPDGPLAKRAGHTLATGVRSSTWTSVFAGRASDTLACSLLWLLVAQQMPDALGSLTDLLHPDPENPR